MLPPVYSTTLPDGASRPDSARSVNDRYSHAVFHAAGRVLPLDFHEHASRILRHEPLQFDERRLADGVEYFGSFCHPLCLEVTRNSTAVSSILFAEYTNKVLFLDEDQEVHVGGNNQHYNEAPQ